MTRYHIAGRAVRGTRLHQNENTAGCSPRVLEALAYAAVPIKSASTRRNAETTETCARYLGAPAGSIALVNGLDEGITGDRDRHLRSSAGGFVPEAIIPEPAFGSSDFDTELSAVGRGDVALPDFSFPLDGCSPRSHRNPRGVPHQPNNSTGVSMPLTKRSAPSPAPCRRGDRVRGRGVRGVLRRHVHPRLPVPGPGDRRPNVLKAFGLAGLRIGCLVGATSGSIRMASRPRLQRQHRGGRRRARRARAIGATSMTTSGSVGDRRRCSTRRAIGSAWKHRKRRELRAGRARRTPAQSARTAPPRAAFTSVTARPNRLRRLRPHRHRRRSTRAAVHRRDGRGAMRRGVIDRRTTETQIAFAIALMAGQTFR